AGPIAGRPPRRSGGGRHSVPPGREAGRRLSRSHDESVGGPPALASRWSGRSESPNGRWIGRPDTEVGGRSRVHDHAPSPRRGSGDPFRRVARFEARVTNPTRRPVPEAFRMERILTIKPTSRGEIQPLPASERYPTILAEGCWSPRSIGLLF